MTGYWFCSWEEVSIIGGAIQKCAALQDHHPFVYMRTLRECYIGLDLRVSITLLFFTRINRGEYELAEQSDVISV